jgi:hypothetical protein
VATLGGEPVIVLALAPIPFAHAGHVLIDLPIFLGPVVMVALWLWIANRRDRRATRKRDGEGVDGHV